MAKRQGQMVTKKIKHYLEDKGFNKAEIARRANIKPDDFYLMLDNFRVMSADEFIAVCKALDVNLSIILES